MVRGLGFGLWMLFASSVSSQELDISNVPVFLTSPVNPNVLVILDNSNSMDELADGSIATGGGANSDSKSEIARSVIKNMVADYQTNLNIGLMAYQQQTSGSDAITSAYLHDALVDLAYSATSPYAYDPDFSGSPDSDTKRIQQVNPSDSTQHLYANVSLPFYSSANQNTAFCYSPTANGLNNGEDLVLGPWDNYRCFGQKTGPSNDLPVWQDTADETAKGYLNYLFTIQLYPTDSDIAQGITDFGRYLYWTYKGQTWYSNTSPGRGYLHVPIATVDAGQKSKLDTKLATSQFVTNAPIDPNYPIQNAGLTPIQGSLKSAKDYFTKTPNDAEGYPSAVCDALPESCDKNFVILVTDGMPSVDENGSTPADTDAAISQVKAAASELLTAGIKTYVIGFALPFGVDEAQLNDIASEGGTAIAYNADDEESLEAAIESILSDIFEQTASAAPIVFSTNALNVSNPSDPAEDQYKTLVYQTQFNSADWSGTIEAFAFDDNGNLKTTPEWSVNDAGQIASHSSRIVISSTRELCVGVCTGVDAIGFRWSALTDADRALLDDSPSLLDYIRGDRTYEGSLYRTRTTLIGDMVGSEPVYVAEPFYHYPDTLESVSYSSFVDEYQSRRPMLYVGANDGMFHAFDAKTGEEVFAYVPNELYGRLPDLAKKNYSHKYYVDGSPTVVDAFFSGQWNTVVANGLNAGGQGVFALNITDPATFTTENVVKNALLWEFSDLQDEDMGYSYSQPNIVKMHDDSWVAIFGNGYNNTEADGYASTTGNAVLYILDLESGTVLAKIDTKSGRDDDPLGLNRPNGLATVAPVDLNNDRKVDVIYAGDLFGNLWKFDVSSATPSLWKTAFGSTAQPEPLFSATTETGYAQPIMARPEVGRHQSKEGVLIYFGTGKYIETADNTQSGQLTQTMYGIWDNGSRISSRSQLLEQKIIKEGLSNGLSYRVITNNELDWNSYRGWYVDLYNQDEGNTDNAGERIVTSPVLRDGRIVFTSMIPTDDVCLPGGEGWIMELDSQTGSRVAYTVYDIDGNSDFDGDDFVNIGTETEPEYVSVSGLKLDVGLPTSPGLISAESGDVVLVTGSDASIQRVERNASRSIGRQSWRQVY